MVCGSFFQSDRPSKGKATCTVCPPPGRILSFNGSTTSNLWAHVKSQHARAFAARGSNSTDSRNLTKSGSASVQCSSGSASQISASMKNAVCLPGRSRKITHLLAIWCARDVRPMSIVEDKGLKDVFALVEPGYQLPSKTHITNILKCNYQLGLEALRGWLNVDEATTLSFTTDVWTSGAVEAYLTLTGHFVTADFSLVSWCLGTAAFPERHTGMSIAKKVKIMLATFRVPEGVRQHSCTITPPTCRRQEIHCVKGTMLFSAWCALRTDSKTPSRLDCRHLA